MSDDERGNDKAGGRERTREKLDRPPTSARQAPSSSAAYRVEENEVSATSRKKRKEETHNPSKACKGKDSDRKGFQRCRKDRTEIRRWKWQRCPPRRADGSRRRLEQGKSQEMRYGKRTEKRTNISMQSRGDEQGVVPPLPVPP
jgi:hypothetical protein